MRKSLISDTQRNQLSVASCAKLCVGILRKLQARLGIDRAIAFTILARGWASVAGLVTVALIARFLTPVEQGYYYTFGSLIALQIVFELGFSFVILQMASHERAHLEISADGIVSGDEAAHARLASVLQKTVRWYSVAALLLAIFLVVSGVRFFASHQHPGEHVSWRLPWYAVALASTITFQLDPILSFMEGCGYVSNVARLRFAQAVIGSSLAWLVLVLHCGLFAPAMVILGNAAGAFTWLLRRRNLLLPLLRYKPGMNRVHWMQEVWPFQWRIGLSWLCGYFIFQLYNPVLFAYRGPIEAGQMGMSLAIANALQAVAISWVNTKAAPFGTMIARKQFMQLDQIFFKCLRQSLTVCAFGACFVWLAVLYMHLHHIRFSARVLDLPSLAILLFTALLNVVVTAEAVYLRAHKHEKFLLNSVLGAILMTFSTYFLGKQFGAFGMVCGSLAVAVFMGIPLGTYVFLKYRRIWHDA